MLALLWQSWSKFCALDQHIKLKAFASTLMHIASSLLLQSWVFLIIAMQCKILNHSTSLGNVFCCNESLNASEAELLQSKMTSCENDESCEQRLVEKAANLKYFYCTRFFILSFETLLMAWLMEIQKCTNSNFNFSSRFLKMIMCHFHFATWAQKLKSWMHFNFFFHEFTQWLWKVCAKQNHLEIVS